MSYPSRQTEEPMSAEPWLTNAANLSIRFAGCSTVWEFSSVARPGRVSFPSSSLLLVILLRMGSWASPVFLFLTDPWVSVYLLGAHIIDPLLYGRGVSIQNKLPWNRKNRLPFVKVQEKESVSPFHPFHPLIKNHHHSYGNASFIRQVN